MEQFYDLYIKYADNSNGYARMTIDGIIEFLKNEIDNIKNISIQ